MSSTQWATDPLARVRSLPEMLSRRRAFCSALEALAEGRPAAFDQVWGSSSALLAAALLPHSSGVLVVVCPKPSDVDAFCSDFTLFSPAPAHSFPAWERSVNERTLDDVVCGDRLRVLKRLNRQTQSLHGENESLVLVTSMAALLQPVPDRATVRAHSRRIAVGDALDVDDLLRWLVQHGFHHATAVDLPGEFARRGGIIDVFAPDWDEPIRIELFDDVVESLRPFDVASQRSRGSVEYAEVSAPLLDAATGNHFSDHLPPGTWWLLVEPAQILDEAQRFVQLQEDLEQIHSVSAVQQQWNRFSVATAAAIAESTAEAGGPLGVESVERFSGDIGRVRSELEQAGREHQVFVVVEREAEAERLRELLATTDVARQGGLAFPAGTLSRGFRLVEERIILVSSHELFHRSDLRRDVRRHLGKTIDSFLDLREGDLVVHLSHGIGRYRGMELLEKHGRREEHLTLEFDGGTKIYVPASKIDLVQKYVGGTKSRPRLARLGGSSWLRQKQAAEAAVVDLAAEMLEMQAQRLSRQGIAFAPDGEWQHEFDASFPYVETPDQVEAIRAIKQDMMAARPMDRLLCGDVGFGKTEVAMRAAFKAVDNGYQVAVLVPTTILAEQHYRTFTERMAAFPFDIARLSRFCSRQEERRILEGLAGGQIDIVVGTHRLVSKDVRFHNLGLIIIDEEQRFGVEVKERLKSFRATVDVLTMTATPIPRTLHMSLVGVRDISNLETAPEDRLNVETHVVRFNRELIRHAVLRELNRGGQIFFVHNRVQDIHVVAEILRQTVPEAELRIGHGQMREDELEQVMVDFVAGRFDLLLATTIVESGLDIPNANTMFIDEADRYGLADLHQLRGRVGRYKHRAYCYLLLDPRKPITPNAAKRLRAIEEYSEIGSGFALSMRDLEIRGAGNLLGVQQSGHIATVGYELYCQLLEGAVRRLKHLPPKPHVDVEIDLPGEAFLPDQYVPDMRLKIDLYRRLRRVTSYDELADFRAEIRDRFGAPPLPARRLLDLAELRLDAASWQLAALFLEDDYLVFRGIERSRLEQLARRCKPLRLVDGCLAYLKIAPILDSPDRIRATAKSVLRGS